MEAAAIGLAQKEDRERGIDQEDIFHGVVLFRRCLTGVDSRSKGLSKFVSIDKESNHEIMHVLRLGEANCAADEALDPGPQIDVFALNFLCVLLAHLMLLSIAMPLVGPPAIGVKLCDAKRCQQLLELQEDVVLPSSDRSRWE